MRTRNAGWGFVGLLVATLAVGCGGSTSDDAAQSGSGGGAGSGGSGGSGGSAGDGGCGADCAKDASAGCPDAPPQDHAACAAEDEGTSCHYAVPCCGDTVATCSGGAWSVVPGPCMGGGGAPACPPDPPPDGMACDMGCGAPLTCTYDECATKGESITATCTGTWSSSVSSCPNDGGAYDGGGGLGALCGQSAGGASCAPGLACCYPCGIPGCDFQCTTPCQPGQPGCSNGCMMYP